MKYQKDRKACKGIEKYGTVENEEKINMFWGENESWN